MWISVLLDPSLNLWHRHIDTDVYMGWQVLRKSAPFYFSVVVHTLLSDEALVAHCLRKTKSL